MNFLQRLVYVYNKLPVVICQAMRTICLGLLLIALGVGQPAPLLYRVVIDAAHGGDDTGGIGLYGLIEKDIVLQIAHLIAIEATGFPQIQILLTRADDRYLSPSERLAKAQGADVFISLHLDFSYDPRVRGITALLAPSAQLSSWQLAEILHKRLATKAPDLGIKTAPLWLRRLPTPAVQLNLGFVTNPDEARKLMQITYQRQLATAIVEGIKKFVALLPH